MCRPGRREGFQTLGRSVAPLHGCDAHRGQAVVGIRRDSLRHRCRRESTEAMIRDSGPRVRELAPFPIGGAYRRSLTWLGVERRASRWQQGEPLGEQQQQQQQPEARAVCLPRCGNRRVLGWSCPVRSRQGVGELRALRRAPALADQQGHGVSVSLIRDLAPAQAAGDGVGFGKRMTTRNPGVLSTSSICAWCRSATALTRANPNPLPGVERLFSPR